VFIKKSEDCYFINCNGASTDASCNFCISHLGCINCPLDDIEKWKVTGKKFFRVNLILGTFLVLKNERAL